MKIAVNQQVKRKWNRIIGAFALIWHINTGSHSILYRMNDKFMGQHFNNKKKDIFIFTQKNERYAKWHALHSTFCNNNNRKIEEQKKNCRQESHKTHQIFWHYRNKWARLYNFEQLEYSQCLNGFFSFHLTLNLQHNKKQMQKIFC